MLTDSIADMLTRIRNAARTKSEKVDIPASKMKVEIAKILKEEGYIKTYKILRDKRQGILRINLRYIDNEGAITGIKRVSKPGRRVYIGKKDIPKVMGGLGISILTTSKGVLSDKVCRHEGIGGEILCYVW